jgi:hypothetical protein
MTCFAAGKEDIRLESILTCACSVCDPAKVFLTSKYLLLSNSTTAYRWELLIANHLDESL